MKYILKYWPILLIILAFMAGNFMGNSSSDKELERKYQKEQQTILEVIGQKDAEIMRLNARSRTINEQRVKDSLQFAGALESNKRAYTALKKKYNEINLNRATVHQLDSLVAVLLPNREPR